MSTEISTEAKYSQPDVVDFWAALNQQGLQHCEGEMVRRYLPPQGYLLDVGCGTGRAVLALSDAGYQVTGIDLSLAMLAVGRQQAAGCRLSGANVMALPFADGTFDAVLMFFGALQHIRGRRNRQQAILEMARVVPAAGRVIMGLDNIAPGLACYAYWLQRIWRNRNRPQSLNGSAQPTATDTLLWQPRTHPILWHTRGLLRTLRWRTWPDIVDLARSEMLLTDGADLGDLRVAQFSVPPTPHTIYYHLYRASELIEDAAFAGLSLIAFHSGAELNDGVTYPEFARGQDKQLLFVFEKAAK